MSVLSKEAQIAEAKARAENGVAPGETAAALETVVDDVGGEGDAPVARAQTDETAKERTPPPTRGAFEDKRAEIIKRFRSGRTEDVAEQAEDISAFARSGMPPEFEATEPDADRDDNDGVGETGDGDQHGDGDPAVRGQPAPAPAAPQMVKVKVRGVEQEMTLEDALSAAQKGLAGDNYLEEARALLTEAKNTVRRTDQAGHHAGQQQPGHHAGTEAAPASTEAQDGSQHPENPFAKLIDTMQFGDPAEAQQLLETTLRGIAGAEVSTALQTDRLKDEGARTLKVLKEFESNNEEIAKDPKARRVIEGTVFEYQAEDIKALGVDPAKLEMSVADAHRWYRANGFKVRAPQELLEKALEDFTTWKGNAPTQQAPRQGAPRIEVNVDRNARRQAIPQQPSRTVVPKLNQQNQPQARDRSQIVESMRQRRSLPKHGKNIVV